jgi:hypothetical protein
MRRGELFQKAALAYDIESGPTRVPESIIKLYGELGKAQSNLNQIARQINMAAKSRPALGVALADVTAAAAAARDFKDILIGARDESQD